MGVYNGGRIGWIAVHGIGDGSGAARHKQRARARYEVKGNGLQTPPPKILESEGGWSGTLGLEPVPRLLNSIIIEGGEST